MFWLKIDHSLTRITNQMWVLLNHAEIYFLFDWTIIFIPNTVGWDTSRHISRLLHFLIWVWQIVRYCIGGVWWSLRVLLLSCLLCILVSVALRSMWHISHLIFAYQCLTSLSLSLPTAPPWYLKWVRVFAKIIPLASEMPSSIFCSYTFLCIYFHQGIFLFFESQKSSLLS